MRLDVERSKLHSRTMPRIAVIADTHDRLPDWLVDYVGSADEIWHLGDVCKPSVLDGLLALGRPLHVVEGNCDIPGIWRLRLRLECEGHAFQLEHVPPREILPGVTAVLHGHTHVPRDEVVRGVRFLNPGCITRPNRGAPASLAWLTVERDREPEWGVVRLASLGQG